MRADADDHALVDVPAVKLMPKRGRVATMNNLCCSTRRAGIVNFGATARRRYCQAANLRLSKAL